LIDWGQKTVANYRPDALERALPEHLEILTARKERDVDAAQNIMRAHLKGTLTHTLEMWADMPNKSETE
jgi:DNA-binding GntR family transcriptional regulator